MKRFIIKIFLMMLLAVMTLTAVALVNKRYFLANNYLMEFPVKQRLIADTPSPKLVVLGGSNVAFGINCETLSDSLGMPVVNAGLHAGLGLRYIMHANTPFLCRGDILVVMPEYEHFFGKVAWGESKTISVIPYFATPREMADMNREQFSNVCKGWGKTTLEVFVKGVKNLLHPNSDNLYHKSGFDSRGDEVSHRSLPSEEYMRHLKPSSHLTSFNEMYLDEFISDVRSLQKRGAHVYLLPPSILKGALAVDRRMIEQLSERLSAVGIPYIASIDTFSYPNEFLFDTVYHLNADGVQLNTKHILSAIRPKIKQNNE